MRTQRFCVNCTHFRDSHLGVEYGKCSNVDFYVETSDYRVSGKIPEGSWKFATTQRAPYGMCGIEGSDYSPKKEIPPPPTPPSSKSVTSHALDAFIIEHNKPKKRVGLWPFRK